VTEPWIVAENIGLAPAVGNETDDEVDRETRPTDYWLACQDL
jgi:hypothetical protein